MSTAKSPWLVINDICAIMVSNYGLLGTLTASVQGLSFVHFPDFGAL